MTSPYQLAAIYLHADQNDIDELGGWILRTMQRYDVTTSLRQAHFLAQVGHESGELRWREELASGAAYEGRRDLGNTHRGDGKRFKGRGLIQLTGRANYAEFSYDIGLGDKLTHSPELVAEDPELCCGVAGWFWEKRHLNALADLDALRSITRRINGGQRGLRDRQRLLTLAKHELIGHTTVRAGGGSVVELQRLLNRIIGAGLSVDGVEGTMTRRAVAQFQRSRGLTADGNAGPETWAALNVAKSARG